MKCQKCGTDTFLPFRCQYCGDYFCPDHRLPENHQCPQVQKSYAPREEATLRAVQTQTPHEYTVTYAPTQTVKRRIYFSPKELKHLAVAALIVGAIGFSPALYDRSIETTSLALLAVILITSFFTHEIAHKVTAQTRALWAEFRLTLMGTILTVFSIFSLFFKIISPGAVMVAGHTNIRTMGKISLSGPVTNIILSAALLAPAYLTPQYSFIFALGAAFNAWIALFNLIPIGILDGYKIFLWNKRVWTLAFAASLALTIVSYSLRF